MSTDKYGAAHRRERKRWKTAIDAGEVYCCLCGAWLPPGADFDLDHLPGTDTYRGAACPSCNRRDGAVRRNGKRSGRPKRPWVL